MTWLIQIIAMSVTRLFLRLLRIFFCKRSLTMRANPSQFQLSSISILLTFFLVPFSGNTVLSKEVETDRSDQTTKVQIQETY
jgi:hypothetical protein